MGIAQKAAGASWSRVKSGLLVPDRRFLVTEAVFGDTLAKSIYNRANPAKPLTVVGSPTINASSATVKSGPGGYGFETSNLSSDDRTLILVRRNPTPGGGVTAYAGRRTLSAGGAGNDLAWCLRNFGSNNYAGNGEATGSFVDGASRATPAGSGFYFEAAVAVPNGFGQLHFWNGSSMAVATSSVANGSSRFAANNQSVDLTVVGTAGITDSNSSNTFDVAYLLEFNRPLGASEIAAIRTNIIADGARRGFAIT
ncbi:MAG: hypothetical protein JWR85_3597 [Marmoricola sp.]|nr:hypothetical protein [Marmoricola sp.]